MKRYEWIFNELLSERSQSEKSAYCMIPIMWRLGKAKLKRQQKNEGLPGIWRGVEGGWIDEAQSIF